MTTRNKTNLICLLLLALFLTIACSEIEETETVNTAKENVASTGGDEVPADDDDGEDADAAGTNNGPTTVRFASGRTSRTYKNSITARDAHTYFLTASAGQTMNIKINSAGDHAVFVVHDPSGTEISAGEETVVTTDFSQELDNSGQYKIVVSSLRGDASYEISFEVSAKSRDLTSREAEGGANKTVRFGRGNSSASYSNSVIRGDRDTYILGAKAGQFMTVSITSHEDNAGFQIVAPNGTSLVDDDTNWTDELPRDGNYKIIVGSGRGNATYTIRFSVEQSPIDH